MLKEEYKDSTTYDLDESLNPYFNGTCSKSPSQYGVLVSKAVS